MSNSARRPSTKTAVGTPEYVYSIRKSNQRSLQSSPKSHFLAICEEEATEVSAQVKHVFKLCDESPTRVDVGVDPAERRMAVEFSSFEWFSEILLYPAVETYEKLRFWFKSRAFLVDEAFRWLRP